MREKLRQRANEQQIVAHVQERKMLGMMARLKSSGGPFTSTEQVEAIPEDGRGHQGVTAGMKMELQFARFQHHASQGGPNLQGASYDAEPGGTRVLRSSVRAWWPFWERRR